MNNGGPAFPRPIGHYPVAGCTYNDAQAGMTLRDYFAAAALTGLLAEGSGMHHDAVMDAFVIADDMILRRSK